MRFFTRNCCATSGDLHWVQAAKQKGANPLSSARPRGSQPPRSEAFSQASQGSSEVQKRVKTFILYEPKSLRSRHAG